LGGIYEFLEKKKLSSLRELEIKDIKNRNSQKPEIKKNKMLFEEKKELERNIKKISNQVSISERKIESIELKISEIGKLLEVHEANNQYMDYNSLYQEYLDYKNELDKEMELWAEHNENLNNLKILRENYANK